MRVNGQRLIQILAAFLAGASCISATGYLRSLAANPNAYCDDDALCAKIFNDGSRPCCNFQAGVCEARDSPNAITQACRTGGAPPQAQTQPETQTQPQAQTQPEGDVQQGAFQCGKMSCASNQVCGTFTGSCVKESPACTKGQVKGAWTGDFQACIDPSQCGMLVDNEDPGYEPSKWRC